MEINTVTLYLFRVHYYIKNERVSERDQPLDRDDPPDRGVRRECCSILTLGH